MPQFLPFDDIYHAKRIAFSAAHPFRVLSFDPNQGPSGSFCPWPPLYDMSAGLLARLFAGPSPIEALSVAAWIPPFTASLFSALVVVALRRVGLAAAVLAGLGIAFAVYYFDNSRLGAIDHHFLEPVLVLGVLAATTFLARAENGRRAALLGSVFGLSLVVALLVQPLLLTAGAISLSAILLFDRSNIFARIAGALGFLLASGIVFFYGWMQSAGYPENEWYLGNPHAAALLAASAVCAVQVTMLRRGSRRRPLLLPLVLGGLVFATVPHALEAFANGFRFFGGDPWLRYLSEFQPLFFRPGSVWPGELSLLGGGALLAGPMALSPHWRRGRRQIVLLFTVVYLIAALSSVRFLIVAGPLLAIAGAVYFRDLQSHPYLAGTAAALLLLPGLLLTAGRVFRLSPPIPKEAIPMVRAVQKLPPPHSGDPPERVLAPWHWGHFLNVVGGRSVLLSSFGPVGGRGEFENSLGILFVTREEFVADYCRSRQVRYLLLRDPRPSLGAYAEVAGLPRRAFESNWVDSEKGSAPTRLMRRTFWWRAYFHGATGTPGLGEQSATSHLFRLLHVTEPVDGDSRSRVQIWELAQTK